MGNAEPLPMPPGAEGTRRTYKCGPFNLFTCKDDCLERRYCTWFPGSPQTPYACPPAGPGLPGSVCDDYWRYK